MDDLARENEPFMTGDGQETLQQQPSNNAAAAAAAPPTNFSETDSHYPPPPPLDDGDDFPHETTIEEWSSSSQQLAIQQEESPRLPTVVEPFQSTAAASATTTVVDDYNIHNADANNEVAPFVNVSVDFDKIYSHQSPIMDSHEQQQQQSNHFENEESSTHPQPVIMEGQPVMPSQGGDHQQQQMPYNYNDNINDDSNSRKRAYHGFASSDGMPESEQNQQQQQQEEEVPYSPPPTLPPILHSQYPPYNHHHSYYHYSPHHPHQPEQQQQLHSLDQEQQQSAMNDPNYENIHMIHEQEEQHHPPPPPLPHHHSSPPYNSPPLDVQHQHYHHQHQHPPYQQQQQHHHQYLHQHDYNQPHPSSNHHHHPNNTNNHHHHHHLGFNTDRPTYTFSLPTDSQSLSDRQCYIRSNFIELFIATDQDVSARPAKGSQKITVGQVGIRCAYCVDNSASSSTTSSSLGGEGGDSTNQRKVGVKQQQQQQLQPRVERAVCYPQSISRIYQTVADMQRRHFEKCTKIPVRVMGTCKSLKSTRPRGKGNPQAYWESSAREIGLVDSLNGRGIRVMMKKKEEEGDGGGEEGMVERFLLQRKNGNVEGAGDGDGGGDVAVADSGVVEHYSNESSAAPQVEEGGDDYEKKPRAKRPRTAREDNETGNGKEGDQSSNMQSHMNGGQEAIANYTAEQQPPPPISSFSDAHLLASMRDGASPSLNEKEPPMMMPHGMMMENSMHELEMHLHQQQQERQMAGAYHTDKGDNNLGEELTQHYLNEGLEMPNQQTGWSDANLQEDSANIATNGMTTVENECKVIEEV